MGAGHPLAGLCLLFSQRTNQIVKEGKKEEERKKMKE
jgi:hypothetical protein